MIHLEHAYKAPKPHLVAKRKGKGFSGFDEKTTKSLPDTSRIPWFPTLAKTRTDV